uniref:F5/8 type C domain-containing protein n=1 Tax=Syphacia muris TaxID=451379 RepID=A0A0N5AM19_9BILA
MLSNSDPAKEVLAFCFLSIVPRSSFSGCSGIGVNEFDRFVKYPENSERNVAEWTSAKSHGCGTWVRVAFTRISAKDRQPHYPIKFESDVAKKGLKI